MIYTVTFSPSIDYIPYVEDFQLNTLNRASEVSYYPGGKGINISRVLARLNCETTALGFLGGFTGRYIQDFLNEEMVNNDFIQIKEATRINVKIKSSNETDVNGPSPKLTEENAQQLMNRFEKQLQQGDWVIVSGTIPSAIPDSFFEQLQQLSLKTNARWVLDTSGPRLRALLNYKPYLIKPNQQELSELIGHEIETTEDVMHYAQQIVAKGIPTVVVSLGGAGAVCTTKDDNFVAKAPVGQVVNTVGAGDSVVAGMVSQLAVGESMQQAFKYGVAAGSATAFHEDLCTASQIQELVEQVVLQP
ncbi:MAG: 1-phosphofructokinase [Kurthia sp.]|nr:1-phosphofructokinase [Candidatus Kurthia equi]